MVTYISGRSFSGGVQEQELTLLANLDVAAGLADFGQSTSTFSSQGEEVTDSSAFKCFTDFGFCLSSSAMMAMKEDTVTEGDILTMVTDGLAEYVATGDIGNTWKKLREIKHVVMAAMCLQNFKIC